MSKEKTCITLKDSIPSTKDTCYIEADLKMSSGKAYISFADGSVKDTLEITETGIILISNYYGDFAYPMNTNQWHKYSIRYDDNKLEVYVDNKLKITKTSRLFKNEKNGNNFISFGVSGYQNIRAVSDWKNLRYCITNKKSYRLANTQLSNVKEWDVVYDAAWNKRPEDIDSVVRWKRNSYGKGKVKILKKLKDDHKVLFLDHSGSGKFEYANYKIQPASWNNLLKNNNFAIVNFRIKLIDKVTDKSQFSVGIGVPHKKNNTMFWYFSFAKEKITIKSKRSIIINNVRGNIWNEYSLILDLKTNNAELYDLKQNKLIYSGQGLYRINSKPFFFFGDSSGNVKGKAELEYIKIKFIKNK